MDRDPRARFDRGTLLIVGFVVAITGCLAFAPAIFNDGDTSWHLATGRWILANASIPVTDPFSFTFVGRAWTAHEWLAEILMAKIFAFASWGGLAVMTAGALGSLLLLLALELRRWLAPSRVIVALTLVTAMLAPFVLARPHVLAWPLLASWTIVLLRAREAERAPPLVAALLMVVWANLHASFIIGLVLIGAFALEAILDAQHRRHAFRGWATFGLLSAAISLLTPHGVQGLLYPFQVSSMKALPLIMEWRRTNLSQDWLFLTVTVSLVLLVLVRRPPLSAVRVVLLIAIIYLALSHVRHQPLVAILGVLLLAEPLSETLRPVEKSARSSIAVFAFSLFLIAAVRIPLAPPRQDTASNPITAIRHVPSDLRNQPVLNSYGFGGPLILDGIRPYIDGRGDMYNDAFMFEHQRIIDGDAEALGNAVARWRIAWTILGPGDPLVGLLDRSKGWHRVYSDRWAVIHARD